MSQPIVRIQNIKLQNFKNVESGELSFNNPKDNYQASIVGLYGQNGSGKTAIIDAVALLKYALCGSIVPRKYADYINVNAEFLKIKYEIKINDIDAKAEYIVTYQLSLRKENDVNMQNTENDVQDEEQYRAVIFDEILSYSYEADDVKFKLAPVIDTGSVDIFEPKTKYDILVGKDKGIATDLIVAKKLALATSRSFVFSKELLTVIRKNCSETYHVNALDYLVNYGNYGLFVIDTRNSGIISLDALPLAFKYENQDMGVAGSFPILLNKASIIPQDAYDIVVAVIDNMNIVLTQLIPGLTIGVINLGPQVMRNGKNGYKVQLVSRKNKKDIPLQHESEGIKKIISILQLLIVVYNTSSITVAIDELDAGVFEYLLGEILHIISEKGKGQLVFTSHNLRPLETIDKGFVAFTTTNPSRRYIRLSNVKSTNNLRDFYYRDIVLGEQNEPVYEPTNNYEIALAFREAAK
jgi:AAA15 family ATPase/GTPase